MIIPVPSVHKPGVLLDLPPHRIPLSAWSHGVNARFGDGFVEGREGFTTRAAPPSPPISLFALPTSLVVACQSAVYRLVGSTFTTIGSGFTGGQADYWLGGPFNNWLCITNGVDVPQVLEFNNPSATLSPLPNWPTGYKVRVIRPYKSFLVGLVVSTPSYSDTRRVKWSHPAEPGTLPASWDHTDPSREAGELTLAEGYDNLVDGIQFGDEMYLFTANQTWVMRYVGGQSVFSFAKIADDIGLMASDCMAVVPGVGLVVLTGSDVVVMPQGQSIADGSVRRAITANVDPTFYHRSRMLVLPDDKELWIFIPEAGSSLITKAFVWNWRFGSWSTIDLDQVRSVAARRASSTFSVETIDSDTTQCDTADGVLCDAGPPMVKYSRSLWLGHDNGIAEIDPYTAMGVVMERQGFAFVGPDKVDEYGYKRAIALRLDVTGPEGAVVRVTPGWQLSRAEAVHWGGPVDYVIGQTEEVQFTAVGRFLAFRFEWDDPGIKVFGYTVELHPLGQAL